MIRSGLVGAALSLLAVLPVAAQEYVPDPEYARDAAVWAATPKTCAGYRAYLEGDTRGVYTKEAVEKRTELGCLKPSSDVRTLSLSDLRTAIVTPDDFPARAIPGTKGVVVVECIADAKNRLSACRMVSETPQGQGFGQATVRAVAKRGRTLKPWPDGQRLQMTISW